MQNSVPAWHGSCVSPSSTGQAVAPDLAVVCARELVRHRENLPSKEAVEKGCVFFLSSAAHIVSAECLFQEKLLMLINRKCQWVWITVSWREEKKVPKSLCLKKKTFLCKYSVNLISVVGEIQASSHLLNSPMFLGPALCLLWGQCCSSHPTSVRCLSIRGNYFFSAGLTVSVLCWPQAGFWVQLCAVKAQVRVLPLCLTFQPILMLLVDFSQNQAHGRELWASKRFMAANWEWGRETLEVS